MEVSTNNVSRDQAVHTEQVRLLFKPYYTSVVATFTAASLFVIAQWQVIDHVILIGWLSTIILVTLARGVLAYFFHRTSHSDEETMLFGRWFIIGAAISGIIWGIGSVLLYPEDNFSHQLVVVLVIHGMCSGAVTNQSVLRGALYAFIIPAMLPIIPLLMAEGNPLSTILVPMTVLLFLFLAKGANNIYTNTEANIRLRLAAVEKEQFVLKAKEYAEKTSQTKSEFLSRMSHELRTPMNAILGFAQILEHDSKGFSNTQRANVREILDAGYHLLDLINEVLDLAKVESGKMTLSMKQVPVDDLLQQCLALIGPQAEKRGVEFVDNISRKGFLVCADTTRLKQVILNLLSNAVKYNRSQGLVTLDSSVIDKQRLKISISDTGKGLSKDDITKLFSPFVRLKAVSHVEGTGIGLTITKHLIELMGGTIGVVSSLGEGSTFWVELDLCGTP